MYSSASSAVSLTVIFAMCRPSKRWCETQKNDTPSSNSGETVYSKQSFCHLYKKLCRLLIAGDLSFSMRLKAKIDQFNSDWQYQARIVSNFWYDLMRCSYAISAVMTLGNLMNMRHCHTFKPKIGIYWHINVRRLHRHIAPNFVSIVHGQFDIGGNYF